MTATLESYAGTPQLLLEQASSPSADHARIIEVADERLHATGDETWAMAKAFALWQLQKPQDAMLALDQAQPVCSDDTNFHMLRGIVARQLPNGSGNDIALKAYREAIRLAPNRDDAYYCLANLLSDNDDPEAESTYRRSIELNPHQYLAWHNLGRMICFDDRHAEAMPLLRQSILLQPTYADGWCNLGLSWLGLKEYDRALGCFYQAVSLDGNHGATHINIGNALISKREPDLALQYLERGAELQSSSANSLWNLSLCYLLLGRFREGWKFYEARYQTDMFAKAHVPTTGLKVTRFDQLPKSNEPPLVVWSEQGMGDSIQFFRYLHLLSAAQVPFEFHVRPQLLTLFNQWSPYKDHVRVERTTDPSKDLRKHVSLMSLPMVFGTELATIPSSVPYLSSTNSPPEHLRVDTPPGGLSVGLVWASNPDNKSMYRAKSMPLSSLMPCLLKLLKLDIIHLHSLQFGDDSSQLDPWSAHDGITVWKDRLADFSETAHVIQQLDLVISVDTAVAHLSGALNIPTWLLLPDNADFRWLRDIDHSPWYPSMRVFRQSTRGDWNDVVSDVQQAFSELVLLDLDSMSKVGLC